MKRELEPSVWCRVSGRREGTTTFRTEARGTRLRKQRGRSRERTRIKERQKGETRSIYLLNVFHAFVVACRVPTGNTRRLKECSRVWRILCGRESPGPTGCRRINQRYLPLMESRPTYTNLRRNQHISRDSWDFCSVCVRSTRLSRITYNGYSKYCHTSLIANQTFASKVLRLIFQFWRICLILNSFEEIVRFSLKFREGRMFLKVSNWQLIWM